MITVLQVIRRAEEVWRDDEGLAAIRDRIEFAAGDFFNPGVTLCSMPPLNCCFLPSLPFPSGGPHHRLGATLLSPCHGLAAPRNPDCMAASARQQQC